MAAPLRRRNRHDHQLLMPPRGNHLWSGRQVGPQHQHRLPRHSHPTVAARPRTSLGADGAFSEAIWTGPKSHLADPALASRLLGLNVASLLDGDGQPPGTLAGTMLGHLFESLAPCA